MIKHTTALAAGRFVGTIRAKRDTLQTLYYASKNSYAEAEALRKKYSALPPLDPFATPAPRQRDMGHAALRDAMTAAQATAEDSAVAFILIADYSIRRLGKEGGGEISDTRTIGGDAYNGVKLNEAIWALANQARHLHDWEANNVVRPREKSVFLTLDLPPLYHQAARMFLERLSLPSYIDFEDRLAQTALDVLAGSPYRLTAASAGMVTITLMGEPPPPEQL